MAASREGLSPAGLLGEAADVVRRRRLLEVDEAAGIYHWAVVCTSEASEGLVQLGGEGTPQIQEQCLGEIALARSCGAVATIHAAADVLDLQHRLRQIWARVQDGVVDFWLPRKIARMTRRLPLDQVGLGLVDAAVARMLGRESAGRILDVVEAKIIEADPVAHQESVEAEKRRRYASLGRSDEYGLRTFVARLDAADAVWIDAVIKRVAEILAPEHQDATAGELRAIALGYLARPAELLALLLTHVKPGDDALFVRFLSDTGVVDGVDGSGETGTVGDPDDETGPAHATSTDAEPEPDGASGLSRAFAFPAELLAKLTTLNLKALAPKVVLYVHLHEAALHGTPGVARVETLGPRTLTQLREMLAGANVTVKPVIDLNDRVRTTAYEHPEALKERILLLAGGEYWPWATSTSRHVDFDHVTPFRAKGPPGQTGTHNGGPLGRRVHNWKTHFGYRARQLGPGSYLWITPHGHCFLVDHHGSRVIAADAAKILFDAPVWVTDEPMPVPADPSPIWWDDRMPA